MEEVNKNTDREHRLRTRTHRASEYTQTRTHKQSQHMNSKSQVTPTEIQSGDRLLLEKAHRYSDSDRDTHYTRVLCEVDEEIAGGFEAHALAESEHSEATDDTPAVGNTEEYRLSVLGDELTPTVKSTSRVFNTTTQWRRWETMDAVYRVD